MLNRKTIVMVVVITILLLIIVLITIPKKQDSPSCDYDEFMGTVNYLKNNYPSIAECIEKGATPEIGAISDTGLALYCVKKTNDYELVQLLENHNC